MRKILQIFKYYSNKRFSTIAGTLVYFFLMSIAPFILWLTLLLGSVDIEPFLSLEMFKGISPFISYLKASAESAASGAGLILIATSLYSSTNFFYHLRRSGEIIYDSNRVRGGIKLRIISVVLIILTILLVALIAAISVTGTWILRIFMPKIISDFISVTFLTIVAFAVAIVLNLFACPYRLRIEETISGSLLTTALWLLFIIGFTIYVKVASPEKLYGAIASVILFLLWCYIMMSCFVIGMINNGSFKIDREHKKLL